MMTAREAYQIFKKAYPKKKIEAMGRYRSAGYLVSVDKDVTDPYNEHLFYIDDTAKGVLYFSPSADLESFVDAFTKHAVDLGTLLS